MRRGLGLPDGVLSIVGEPRWAPQQFWSANSKIRLTTKHTENKRKSLAQIQVIRCSWRPASSPTRTKCGCAYIRHRLMRRVCLIYAQPHFVRVGEEAGLQEHLITWV